MSKYDPLTDYLRREGSDRRPMTFREIESVIGDSLPASARGRPQWWANNNPGSRQSGAWLSIGWRTEGLNLAGERVTFVRGR